MTSVVLGELIREAKAGFASGKRDDAGVIQLRMNNVDTNGGITWNSFLRVPADPDAVTEYQLRPGDVLFNNTNSTALVGKSALFTRHDEPVVYSNHFTRLRTHEDKLLPSYLASWLSHQWASGVFAEICNQWIGQSAVQAGKLLALSMRLPPLAEQVRIVAELTASMATVEKARLAAEARLAAAEALRVAYIDESLQVADCSTVKLGDCLTEVRTGVGEAWKHYPVLGATRAGLAPAKEAIGKHPERYKPVGADTVFYNPMRILLGSIAYVDGVAHEGITSPDYVVFRGTPGQVDSLWFYEWFRSQRGKELILSLSRGAVRERILFNRLAEGEIVLPPYRAQVAAADNIRRANRLFPAMLDQLAKIEALPAALLREVFGDTEAENTALNADPLSHH